MDWYRIKTVLIFLFLAINLFLAALLGYASISENRVNRQKTEAATEMLAKGGITVSAEVPYKKVKLGSLTLENPLADPHGFAGRVLGGETVQEGDTFRLGNQILSVSERAFTYESGVPGVTPSKKSAKAVKKCLENMGFSMKYAQSRIEGDAVIFTLRADKVPLFGYSLSVFPTSDGTVARMEGTWVNIKTESKNKAQTRNAADALLAFLQEGNHAGKEITRVERGYGVLLEESETFRNADAVPVWRIETADGTVRYYDARQ